VFATADGDYHVHGTYAKLFNRAKLYGKEYRYDDLFRPDLADDGSVFYYTALMNGTFSNECSGTVISVEKMHAKVAETLGRYLSTTSYKRTEKRMLDDKEYLTYYDEDGKNQTWIYVDEDNYIVAQETVGIWNFFGNDVAMRDISTLKYTLYSTLPNFIMDTTTTDKCAPAAYKVPTEKQCPDPPIPSSSSHKSGSGSTSIASTAKAAALALLSVAGVALL